MDNTGQTDYAAAAGDAKLAAFCEGLSGLGLTYDQLTACLGGAWYDVYLNDVALLALRPRPRLEVHDRRLPGDEEVALLPRTRPARA